MKNLQLYVLVLLFSFSGVVAQKTRAILVFKNGEELKGYGKLVKNDLLKFKNDKKSKAKEYKFSELDYVQIKQGENYQTYELVAIKGKNKTKALELIEKGKVTLYSEINYGHKPIYTGTTGANGQMYTGGEFRVIKNLYVKRENEKMAIHLGSDQLFSKNFKQAAAIFFQDCSKLVKKIQDKDFKKKEIKEIVQYYNRNCN